MFLRPPPHRFPDGDDDGRDDDGDGDGGDVDVDVDVDVDDGDGDGDDDGDGGDGGGGPGSRALFLTTKNKHFGTRPPRPRRCIMWWQRPLFRPPLPRLTLKRPLECPT